MKPLDSKLVVWAVCLALVSNQIGVSATEGNSGTVGSVAMPTQEDDRGSSQNGASAMALAASAMQQVMCMKMMADAQAKGDSQMMMMAMMMCAQAAANAANAAQNKDGAKKVTSNSQSPTAPSFEKANIDTQPKSDNSNLGVDFSSDRPTAKPEDRKAEATVTFPKQENAQPTKLAAEDKKFGPSDSPINIPDIRPEPSSTINLKDSQNGSMRASLMGSSTPFGSLNNSNNNALPSSPLAASSNEPLESKPGKKSLGKASEGGASGPEGGNLEDLMAKYMNGGAGLGAFGGSGLGGGVIDLALGLQVSGQKPKTIFEFASEQYRQVKSSGRALASKKSVPVRTLASQ